MDPAETQVVAEAPPEQVLPLLQAVSDLLEKRCDRFLTARYSLTTPQFMLLLAATRGDDATLGALSDQLNCSRGNVTGIVDRLERDGWLMRERSREDRRVITVRLTDKGGRVADIQEALGHELGRIAQAWTPEEQRELLALLVRVYRELKD